MKWNFYRWIVVLVIFSACSGTNGPAEDVEGPQAEEPADPAVFLQDSPAAVVPESLDPSPLKSFIDMPLGDKASLLTSLEDEGDRGSYLSALTETDRIKMGRLLREKNRTLREYGPGLDLDPQTIARQTSENEALLAVLDEPDPSAFPLFPIEENGKWGYIDISGDVVIVPRFEQAYHFREGLGQVEIDGKNGFIDRAGNTVIEPQFKSAWPFSEGLAVVQFENRRWGYIDQTGRTVIEPQYLIAFPFTEGLAATMDREEAWGFIDKSGNTVIPHRYCSTEMCTSMPEKFSDGLAAVPFDDKWGYIDKNGEVVIRPGFYEADHFCEGLARVQVDGKWGYIDTAGNYVIASEYDEAYDFSEGFAMVRQGAKKGYIDKTGTVFINPDLEPCSGFHNGLACVKSGEHHFRIDKLGRVVNDKPFDRCAFFAFDLPLAYTSLNGKKVYVDRNFNVVWEEK